VHPPRIPWRIQEALSSLPSPPIRTSLGRGYCGPSPTPRRSSSELFRCFAIFQVVRGTSPPLPCGPQVSRTRSTSNSLCTLQLFSSGAEGRPAGFSTSAPSPQGWREICVCHSGLTTADGLVQGCCCRRSLHPRPTIEWRDKTSVDNRHCE